MVRVQDFLVTLSVALGVLGASGVLGLSLGVSVAGGAVPGAGPDRLPGSSARTGPSPPPSSSPTSFEIERTKVLTGAADADYGRLRELWVGHPSYQPYLHTDTTYIQVIQGLQVALERGDATAAVDVCRASLDRYLVDVQWNVGCARAYRAAGDAEAAARHRRIATGLRDSALASGDGRSQDTAFRVVSVGEQVAVLSALGLRRLDSSSAHPEGRHFDVVTAQPRTGGEPRQVWFDIGAQWEWLRELSGESRP